MIPPFIEKIEGKIFIKLNRNLYKKDLIEKAKRENPTSLGSLRKRGEYYLLEFREENLTEYFDFLNYLIYLKRIQ